VLVGPKARKDQLAGSRVAFWSPAEAWWRSSRDLRVAAAPGIWAVAGRFRPSWGRRNLAPAPRRMCRDRAYSGSMALPAHQAEVANRAAAFAHAEDGPPVPGGCIGPPPLPDRLVWLWMRPRAGGRAHDGAMTQRNRLLAEGRASGLAGRPEDAMARHAWRHGGSIALVRRLNDMAAERDTTVEWAP